MSKIGRRPIPLGDVQVEISGNTVKYKGKKSQGEYVIPAELKVDLVDKSLKLWPREKNSEVNEAWGLHRANLANKIKGSGVGFERQLKIVGLGFKAAATGNKLQFSLGFSHKIDFSVPSQVTIEIDKTGQLLTCKSSDKMILGQVCSQIRALRKPEPYKGTGIQYVNEVIRRKAGKAKSAA